jgi:hypothetical protein
MAIPPDEPTDFQIPPADLALATKLAHKQGVDVEAYLKTLLHVALTRESKAS